VDSSSCLDCLIEMLIFCVQGSEELPPKPKHHEHHSVPHFMLSTVSHDLHVSPREQAPVHHSAAIPSNKLPHFMHATTAYAAHHGDSPSSYAVHHDDDHGADSGRGRSRSPAPSLHSDGRGRSRSPAPGGVPHYMQATTTSEHHTHRELDYVEEGCHSDRAHHQQGGTSSSSGKDAHVGSNHSVASLNIYGDGHVPHYMQQTSSSDAYFHSFDHQALPPEDASSSHSENHEHHEHHEHHTDKDGHHHHSHRRHSHSGHHHHHHSSSNGSGDVLQTAQAELEAAVRALQHDFVDNAQQSETTDGSRPHEEF
jgi:hypothetical protein